MKKKLKLTALSVQSFVTETNAGEVKGGAVAVNLSQVDCPSGLLKPCLTPVILTIPVENCIN